METASALSHPIQRVLVDGPVSKHAQLRRILQEEICSSGQVDHPLASERQLMQAYNVGRSTVREAVDQLIKHGLLYRVPGKGTFIKSTTVTQPDPSTEADGPDTRRRLGLFSFTNELKARGLTPSVKALSVELFINPAIADLLQADPVTPLVMYSRLRLGDTTPMAIQTSYLNASLLGDDAVATLRQGPSLYQVLADRGVTPARASEKYRCTTLTRPETCGLLGLKPGSPVFTVERTTFDANGDKFEYATSILNPDLYTLEIEITQ